MEWDLKSSVLDPDRSKIQDQHLDPYRSKIQDDQHLDPSMWDLKSSVLDPDQSKIQDHLDPSMFIQCYSVPTGRVSTLMIRPPSSNSSSLDIDTEVAEINNNISRR